jgi:EmrB/QacA subfamily drug resistance transporter
VLAVLLLGGLAFALLQTMVAPAILPIAREFESAPSTAAWVLTGFLLSASVATPLVGKLGDLHGRGRVLTAVLVAFALGSALAAVAPTIEVVIAARVLQGVAGGVFPLAFGIIRDTFPPARVPVGIGMMSAMFGIGGGVGLPLSGVIVDGASVHWLFVVGLLALPAALAAWRVVPPTPRREQARVDWPGAAGLSLGLAALLLGVSRAGDWGWGSPGVLGLLAGGLAVLAGWVALEARVADPLVDVRVLRRRPVLATNLVGLLSGFAMFTSFLLVPQFVQVPEQAGYGFGASVTEAGLLMVPTSAVMLVASPLAGVLGARLGSRVPLVAGALFAVAGFVLLSAAHDTPWEIMAANALLGAGLGFSFAAMANLIVESVPLGDVGVATGINTITRTVGGAFGAQLGATIVAAHTIPGTAVPVESGFTAAFWMAAGGALLAALAAAWVPRPSRGGPVGGTEPAPAG